MASEEPVVFDNPRGQRLAGVWHRPERFDGRAAVIAHGLLSGKQSAKHREVCRRLALAGVAALRFDFAGRGSSEGSFAELTVTGEVADLHAAVAEVRARGARQIAVIGSSLGGAVSILAAAEDPQITTLVTVAAPARLPRAARPGWGSIVDEERGESLGMGFFADAARHDLEAAAARVDARWLIVHGAADEVVPSSDAALLATAHPGAALEIHPHADHRFSDLAHLDWLVETVIRFVPTSIGGRSVLASGAPEW